MARKKQEAPSQVKQNYVIGQTINIIGLGECIINDIHDDDGIRLEVYRKSESDKRFKNCYVVQEIDVMPTVKIDISASMTGIEVE